ncbi:ABC transporter ATP-binding protein [Feifania hominis]|uniref:ATP-binding cassette domain-containing protein n=1 Tax=Feifania hominis TaxID=2763660 RepID=A0A926DF68_9FIRM|nr:oligopeptide/dipeptide ABC transporter ATP-binding protein [Feifania hominis]MBC8537028.1 ATP-binding cassette domain-containing protein [Feifania hominis]
MPDTILETRNLKKYFSTSAGVLHAVDDVSFTLERGSTLGVVGESGCGKSTLGRVVLRLLEATGGEVLFNGQDIMKLTKPQMREMRRKMQMIFQDPYASINPRMSVSDIIADPLRVNGICESREQRHSRVEELMQTVGLSKRFANAYPHELDGGRRQRIGIARALALEPEFIVCDEPVSALDVSIQAQILNLMMDLQEQMGLTYIFITHDMSVVRHISNEIMVMYMGQCVEKTSSHELFANPLHPYTEALLDAIPVPNFSRRGRPRKLLTGEVTSPINPKPGCRFAPRCPHATPACTGESIPLREVSPGHFVACVLR